MLPLLSDFLSVYPNYQACIDRMFAKLHDTFIRGIPYDDIIRDIDLGVAAKYSDFGLLYLYSSQFSIDNIQKWTDFIVCLIVNSVDPVILEYFIQYFKGIEIPHCIIDFINNSKRQEYIELLSQL